MPLRLSTERVLPLEPLTHRRRDDTVRRARRGAGRRAPGRRARVGARDLPPARRSPARDRARRRPARRPAARRDRCARSARGSRSRWRARSIFPERQRTLRAAIDWSYQRLTDEPARPARRAGGLRRRARRSTTRGRSLRRRRRVPPRTSRRSSAGAWSEARRTTASVRLSMLETVREHALDHAAHGRARSTTLRERHAERFLELALDAESRARRARSGALARSSRA